MKDTSIPAKFPIPFASSAASGNVRAIPQNPTSQVGAASLLVGFPPENFIPEAAGGVPPFGEDLNGILLEVTQWLQWYQAGAPIEWDSSFSAAIGGYPKGALVASATTFGLYWLSTADNNLTNPDAGGAGWTTWPLPAYYGDDAGVANAYALTFSPSPYTARVPGTVLRVLIANANSGPSTLDPNSADMAHALKAQIHRPDGTALIGGELFAGQIATFLDNGTYYQLDSVNTVLNVTVVNSSQNFVPTETGWYRITLVGAGGGGANGGNVGGAAGGAGATAIYWAFLVAGQSYAITIGSGGAGGIQRNSTDSGLPGTDGGASTIVVGAVTVTANGGQGGQASTDPGQAGSGGTATNGTLNIAGGDGGNPIWGGVAGIVSGGTGGASSLGGGGAGSTIPGNAANNGRAPGSGGGGGCAVAGVQYAGGSGASGIAIIEQVA